MENIVPLRRPVRWDRLRCDEAERLVRERAKASENVIITHHAAQRLLERGILDIDLFRALRNGQVVDDPVRVNDDWEVKVVKRLKGARDVQTVTIIVRADETLIIKTVMWRDER